jgi:iron complex outermembrane receptor protein
MKYVETALYTTSILISFSSIAAETNTAEIPEVTVTAQLRSQSIQDTPVSVMALSGDDLDIKGLTDIARIADETPSLKVIPNVQPILTAFRIRGIGSNGSIPGFEPEVGLFVDGVFMPRSGLGIGDLVDINQVQVIDGPQSALYGKNVNAGVIAISTKEPPKTFGGMVEATGSVLDGANWAPTERIKASVGGPVSDDLAVSLSGVDYNQNGYEQNLVTDQSDGGLRRFALRGQAVYQPSEDIKFRLIVDHAHSDSQYNAALYQGTELAALNKMLGKPCPTNDPTSYSICASQNSNLSSDGNDASLRSDLELGWAKLTSVSGFTQYDTVRFEPDVSQLDVPLATFRDHEHGDSFTQELRLTGENAGPLQWLAGAYFYHADMRRGDGGTQPAFSIDSPIASLLQIAPGIVAGKVGYDGFFQSHEVTNYEAGFGQLSYKVTDNWTTTGALRVQNESKSASIFSATNETAPSILTLSLMPAEDTGAYHVSDSFVTWSLDNQYRLTDTAMVYANYGRGGKSAGFNTDWGTTTPAERPYKGEIVDSFEAGTKLDLFDRRLRLDAAGFLSIYHNYQEAAFVSDYFLVNNAEKVTTKGVEMQATARLGGGLSTTLSGSYTLAGYDKYSAGSCYPGEMPTNSATGTCDRTGDQLPLVPKLHTGIALDYGTDTALGFLYGRGEWVWSGRYVTDTNYDPRAVQHGFGLVNLRIGMNWDTLDLSVFANNALNKTYTVFTGPSNLFASDKAFAAVLGTPAEYGLTLRKQF